MNNRQENPGSFSNMERYGTPAPGTKNETLYGDTYRILDPATGEPFSNRRYELHFDDGTIVRGVTDKDGKIPYQERTYPAKLTIKILGKEE